VPQKFSEDYSPLICGNFICLPWHFWSFLGMNSSTWNNKMERHANIIHISETNVFAMEKCMTSWCLGHAKITDALMHQDLTKWQYPPHNFIKCNIDVSFLTDHNWVEIGVCSWEQKPCGFNKSWGELGEALGILASMEKV
jgi:hypothetical protein